MQFQGMIGLVAMVYDPLYHAQEIVIIKLYCAVPENIHTPTTEGIGNSRGVGGSKAQEIPEGRGGWRQNSLPDSRKSIDSLRTSEGATYPLL